MSMLGEQIKELREAARNIQGKLGRCLYRRKDVDEMQQVSGMLFEAANTIESLRNTLQELQGVGGESRYTALFGTPERTARTLFEIKCGEKSCNGCPIAEPCAECDVMHDNGESLRAALLEWLRGDV